MGIIKRQAYSGTILTYLGVIIGFVTTALIFPKYLTTAQIGLLTILTSYAYIFAQFATLGTGRVTVVVFPFFRDRLNRHSGFFTLIGLVSLTGILLALLALALMKGWLVSNANDKSPLFGQYFFYLYPLIIFSAVFLVMDTFNTTLLNAVRGIFLKEFLQRILIFLAILPFAFAWIDYSRLVFFYTLAIIIPVLVLVYFVMRNPEFTFRARPSPRLKEKSRLMTSLAVNGIFIGFSGMVILNIDRIMVERFMGLGSTGIYATMAYFATLVAIPSRSLLKISDPIIAQAWKENDTRKISDIYHRSSLNQFLIGCLLLAGIWGNIDNILRILPPEYADGKLVILCIGLAFLADMVTGTATFILANSRIYQYQTYYIFALVILIIITNYLLIPVWGLAGAAFATLLSKILTNLARFLILYFKFGFQPYNARFLLIAVITAITYLAQYFIPTLNNLYADIILRSAVMSIVFLTITISLRISPEVNDRLIAFSKYLFRK